MKKAVLLFMISCFIFTLITWGEEIRPTHTGKGKLKYIGKGKQKYIGNGKQKCIPEGKQKYTIES